MDVLYRIDYHLSERVGRYSFPTPILIMDKYKIIRETPCGFVIFVDRKEKWIGKNSKYRFAHNTKEQAHRDFIARNKRRIAYLEIYLETAKELTELIKDFKY